MWYWEEQGVIKKRACLVGGGDGKGAKQSGVKGKKKERGGLV